MAGTYERYPLDEGDVDALEKRAYVLISVLAACGKDAKEQAEGIRKRIDDKRDEETLRGAVRALKTLFLRETKGRTDVLPGRVWMDVYSSLFDENPYRTESSYVPEDDQMGAVVRNCVAGGVRIQTGVDPDSVG